MRHVAFANVFRSFQRHGQDQVVVALIAVGFLRARIDLDHTPPNRVRRILQGGLVQQVAAAVRGLMMLQRVIREGLFALGEHHAVDLRVGPFAGQRHVLVDLGQPATQRRDRPLQAAVALNDSALMGEVPDAGRPVLQIDVTQPGAGLDDLLETLLTVAELGELTADPELSANGVCLEAFRDEGRGAIAWLIVTVAPRAWRAFMAGPTKAWEPMSLPKTSATRL